MNFKETGNKRTMKKVAYFGAVGKKILLYCYISGGKRFERHFKCSTFNIKSLEQDKFKKYI